MKFHRTVGEPKFNNDIKNRSSQNCITLTL